jgi:hypothetical protein
MPELPRSAEDELQGSGSRWQPRNSAPRWRVDVSVSFEIHWLLFRNRVKTQMATEVGRFAAAEGAIARTESSPTVQEKGQSAKTGRCSGRIQLW